MFNKYAEYEKRRRTYLACRGVLRVKQADTLSDAVDAANARGDEMRARYFRDRAYDRDARAAGIAGGRAGHAAGHDLRAAGREAGAGFDAMGRDIGAGFESNGNTIEDIYSRAGEWWGDKARNAGEGIRQGAGYLANGAYELGKGALGGLANAGKGLASGLDRIGTGMSNGLDKWMTDVAAHPGANAFGLATGLGVGALGHRAGNNIADYFELKDDDWRRKALKWGLAGLGGLGGYWAGKGFGKGFGKAFTPGKPPVDPRDEVPYKPDPSGSAKALPAPGGPAAALPGPDEVKRLPAPAKPAASAPPKYKFKADYFSPEQQAAINAAKISYKNINPEQAARIRNGETLEAVFGNRAGRTPAATGFKGNVKTSRYYRSLIALHNMLNRKYNA